MIDFNSLPASPKGTHWEKRDYVVGGETWCIVRDGLRGAIVARVPRDETERDAMCACAVATFTVRIVAGKVGL